MYDAVVFDNDGVLTRITEEETATAAVRRAFADLGVTDPRPADCASMVAGLTPAEVSDLGERYGVAPADLVERRDARLAEAQKAAAREGGKPLYDDAREALAVDAATGVVSSNQHETVAFLLDHYDLPVDTFYGREPTVESLRLKKPNTHYIDRALDDLGTREALYVGDSPHDVAAAHEAGIDAAFVRREHRADAVLPERPAYEVPDLRTLVEELGDRTGPAGAAADGRS